MTSNNYTRDELYTALLNSFDESDHSAPELYVMFAAIGALPVGQYALYDSEGDNQAPSYVYALPQEQVASWDGTLANSMGYGGINRINAITGPALSFDVAGSEGASASTIWIMHVYLEGLTCGE